MNVTEIFNFDPLVEPTGEGKFRLRKAQFGDGYAQVVTDGLNNEVQTWPLSFAGRSEAIRPILAFLRAHAGSATSTASASSASGPPMRTVVREAFIRAGTESRGTRRRTLRAPRPTG